MKKVICAVALLFGCGDDSMMASPDAAADGPPAIDAAIDAPMIDAPSADAGPNCPASDGGVVGMHKVFLNFEGVTITPSAGGCSNDATMNCSFIATASTTVPQFAAAATNRQQLLDDIVSNMNQVLASYSIEVTPTRPAAGPYKMIVYAQCVSTLGCQTGTGSIGPVECPASGGNIRANDIAFVFEDTNGNAISYANNSLFLTGLANGVSINALTDDCMCNTCGSTTQLCSYSTDVPVVMGTCLMPPARENEQSLLSAALGCR